MTRRGRIALGIGTAVLVLAADQASKWWVLHVLDLPRARHRRAAAGAEPDDGVEPRRHLRAAQLARRPGARRLLGIGALLVVVGARRLAAPRRAERWSRWRSARSPAARSATSSTGCASARWSISSTPTPAAGRGMCSTSPTRRSSAASPRWCWTGCGRRRPDDRLAGAGRAAVGGAAMNTHTALRARLRRRVLALAVARAGRLRRQRPVADLRPDPRSRRTSSW